MFLLKVYLFSDVAGPALWGEKLYSFLSLLYYTNWIFVIKILLLFMTYDIKQSAMKDRKLLIVVKCLCLRKLHTKSFKRHVVVVVNDVFGTFLFRALKESLSWLRAIYCFRIITTGLFQVNIKRSVSSRLEPSVEPQVCLNCIPMSIRFCLGS